MLEKIKSFIKYTITSLASSVVDLAVFTLANVLLTNYNVNNYLFISTIIARIFSSIVVYILNRKYVFNSNGNTTTQLFKHLFLTILQMLLSATFITMFDNYFHWYPLIEKALIDSTLFFIFYFIEKNWVFKDKKS